MMDDIYFSCSCVGCNWYVVLPISSPSWTIVHIKASGNITLESVMEEHCNTHRGSRDMRFGGNRIIAKPSLYMYSCTNKSTQYQCIISIITYVLNTICGHDELTYVRVTHSHIVHMCSLHLIHTHITEVDAWVDQ